MLSYVIVVVIKIVYFPIVGSTFAGTVTNHSKLQKSPEHGLSATNHRPISQCGFNLCIHLLRFPRLDHASEESGRHLHMEDFIIKAIFAHVRIAARIPMHFLSLCRAIQNEARTAQIYIDVTNSIDSWWQDVLKCSNFMESIQFLKTECLIGH